MKKLMVALAAAVLVGVASAEFSFDVSLALSPYSDKDAEPASEHSSWYSAYFMTQASAQSVMGVSETVSYADYADWLGQNFAANKRSTIDNALGMGTLSYDDNLSLYEGYYYGTTTATLDLTDNFGIYFFDNGKGDLAYKVELMDRAMGGMADLSFVPTSLSSGWAAAAVPEPTSGLLMLLGLAGLALKRKRA